MRNWSLVIFTLTIQISVGILGASLIAIWINKNWLAYIPLAVVSTCLGLIGLGLLSAMAHLGNPKNAPLALLNIARSWLSREILTIHLYAVSTAVLWGLTFLGIYKGLWIMEVISLILGISGIVTMSRVYRLRTVPIWNRFSTTIDFLGTTLITGGVASAMLHSMTANTLHIPYVTFLLCTLIGWCCKIAALIHTRSKSSQSNHFWYASSRIKSADLRPTHVILSCLYTIGVALFAAVFLVSEGYSQFFLLISLVFIFFTEIWNRIHFYHSFCRLGL